MIPGHDMRGAQKSPAEGAPRGNRSMEWHSDNISSMTGPLRGFSHCEKQM